MIRVRHFEDKCAELYTQQKIRGFLHLYDGEEAVAAGVIPLLAPRTGSSRPIANTAMRWCAAFR
jgi:TPP-dependent pyruvate/acetoin dehydrogenase alpha subunit